MKTDAYTKIVLTIIAICLTFNVIKDMEIIQSAKAKTSELNSTSSQQSSVIDVKIVDWSGLYYNPIPVTIK